MTRRWGDSTLDRRHLDRLPKPCYSRTVTVLWYISRRSIHAIAPTRKGHRPARRRHTARARLDSRCALALALRWMGGWMFFLRVDSRAESRVARVASTRARADRPDFVWIRADAAPRPTDRPTDRCRRADGLTTTTSSRAAPAARERKTLARHAVEIGRRIRGDAPGIRARGDPAREPAVVAAQGEHAVARRPRRVSFARERTRTQSR